MHPFDVCLRVLEDIIACSLLVSFALLGKSEPGHDGSETARVWILLQITECNDLG